MADKHYKIGEISKLAGVTTVTLRHYHKIKILVPSFRGGGDYRLYSNKDLQRLKFIINAKAAGFQLKEIKALLATMDKADSSAKVKATVNEKLQAIDAQIKSLTYIKKTLKELNQICDGTMPVNECPIISKLRSGNLG